MIGGTLLEASVQNGGNSFFWNEPARQDTGGDPSLAILLSLGRLSIATHSFFDFLCTDMVTQSSRSRHVLPQVAIMRGLGTGSRTLKAKGTRKELEVV